MLDEKCPPFSGCPSPSVAAQVGLISHRLMGSYQVCKYLKLVPRYAQNAQHSRNIRYIRNVSISNLSSNMLNILDILAIS